MEGIKYKLQTPSEGMEIVDKNALIIEKSGAITTFTMDEFYNANKINKKNQVELTAKRNYEAAIVSNIENNNAHGAEIKAMTEEMRYTVHMYQEAAAMVKACDKKLAEIAKAIEENDTEIAEIEKQVPEIVPTPTPEVKENTTGSEVGTPVEPLQTDANQPK